MTQKGRGNLLPNSDFTTERLVLLLWNRVLHLEVYKGVGGAGLGGGGGGVFGRREYESAINIFLC